jgi:hypothetical protein
LVGTIGWNAASGGATAYVKNEDLLTAAIISGGAAAGGYGAAKVVQQPLNKYLNPNWKNWEWVNVGGGISKPMPMNPYPGIAGNIAGSRVSDIVNSKTVELLDKHEIKNK